MAKHHDLYRLVEPLPDLRDDTGRGPVLVHGLEGFSDAGHAIRGATVHLKQHLDAQLIVDFDVDALIDYRSRRPSMHYSFDHFTEYDDPKLQIHAVTDGSGTRFLLLSGLEPDLRWNGFTESIVDLCADLGVSMAVVLGAMPLGVPHTRPIQSSAHSSDVELIRGFAAWPGELALPGSATSLLELRLGENGFPSVGFTVHVPQYLAQNAYPAASLSLLSDAAEVGGLQLPTEDLQHAAEKFSSQIDAQIADNPEISTAIAHMERQYDAYMESLRGSDSLTPGGKPLPSGDEIGAEFERFLAERSADDDPDADQERPADPGGDAQTH